MQPQDESQVECTQSSFKHFIYVNINFQSFFFRNFTQIWNSRRTQSRAALLNSSSSQVCARERLGRIGKPWKWLEIKSVLYTINILDMSGTAFFVSNATRKATKKSQSQMEEIHVAISRKKSLEKSFRWLLFFRGTFKFNNFLSEIKAKKQS